VGRAVTADGPATLPALLDAVAARHGARDALVSRRGRIAHAALAAASRGLAPALRARGVGKGTRVGLLLPNWPEWLVVAAAVWRRGGIVVPLSTLARPRELGHALRHAEVELLIAVRQFLRHDYVAAVAAVAPGCERTTAALDHAALPALRTIVWLDPPAGDAPLDLTPLGQVGRGGARPEPCTAEVAAGEPATIFFTSGTTAEPKGVVHTHGALVCAARDIAATLGIGPEDRTWGYLPFFFTGGLVAVALGTLAGGGAVVLQDVFEAGETLRLLEAERCTVFFAWPHQAEALIAHPAFGATRLRLRKGVGATARWASALYPPDHQAVGTYGMTETGPLCTAWPWDAPLARRAASHGPPVGDREIRIIDPESGAVRPAGAEGEICVRGSTLFAHYCGQAPAACFDRDGFFHTGDLGRLDADGALHFLGRIKDVVKTAGANVAAAEVEAVLGAHPAVGAAHVVGVPEARRGEEVAAFVVLAGPVTEAELLAHCRAELAAYKVPRYLWVRREGELPLKASGKVDKTALRAEATRLATAADARREDPPARPG
jgi:fatty-acyl-CoA synthase